MGAENLKLRLCIYFTQEFLKLNHLYYTENNFNPHFIAQFLVILCLHLYKYWMENERKFKDRAVLPL